MLIFALPVLVVIGLFLALLINSPGKPQAFLDQNGAPIPGSISEKLYVNLDGGRFGLFIKGKDRNNPILLYLHGGMPDYFLTQTHPTGLEEIFTVVWWDQRGAGLSYNAKYSDRNVTIDDLIDDTIGITNYLRSRFSRDKIYLMGHSGGTYLGIRTIEKQPDLYSAYIGVAQISYQKLSEQKAHAYILEQYRNDKTKRRTAHELSANPIVLSEPIPIAYNRLRDTAMHDLGIGTMRKMKNVITGLFIPSLFFREYTLREKIDLWKGKADSGISIIWNELISHDLSEESTRFEIPVYFLHGIHDYTCSYELAEEYFGKINAPMKGFYALKESAHSPIFEEPGECIKIIKEKILKK